MRFVWLWGALFAIGLFLVATQEKLALHQTANAIHGPGLDWFFRWFTHTADGLVPTGLALVLLFYRDVRAFLMMALSCGVSAIVVQLLKRQVFGDMHRPSAFRDALGDLHWVEGVELHGHFSFPSGHSTAAFSMCFALAVVLARPRLAMPLAGLAALMAWSRVYLSQHFLQDAVAGSLLGTAAAFGVYWMLYRSPMSGMPWLDARLKVPGRRKA